ncbi:MAG: DUF3987 domain-containing protein [Cyclobacteriaceae bacterium]
MGTLDLKNHMHKLPGSLKKYVQEFKEKDTQEAGLLCIIVLLGAVMPNVIGYHGSKLNHPRLFLLLMGGSATGKGEISSVKQLIKPIDKYLKGLGKRLLIPLNNTYPNVIKMIDKNDGIGAMIETEADVFGDSIKSEHGNYSTFFRQAYHHEEVTYARKRKDEEYQIDSPQVTVLLFGTQMQLPNLMKDSENGLFGRFMYTFYEPEVKWKDMYKHGIRDLDEIFRNYGEQEILPMYNFLTELQEPLIFNFTQDQIDTINKHYDSIIEDLKSQEIEGLTASVYRIGGTVLFRMAMILSTIRYYSSDSREGKNLVCHQDDFEFCIKACDVFIENASATLADLIALQPSTKRHLFLAKLPQYFTSKDFVKIAGSLDIKRKAAEYYINSYQVTKQVKRVSYGKYEKM